MGAPSLRRALVVALAASSLLAARAALAQGPAPEPYYLAPPEIPPPEVIKWNEGELIPFGYHKSKRAQKGLLIAGSIMFSAAYLPSAVVSFTNPFMAIPVAGPFIVGAQPPASSGNDFGGGSSGNGVFTFWLVFDGIQQAAGLAMFIAAFAAPETVLVRGESPKEAKPWWLPVPMPLGPKAAGLGIVGKM